MFDIERRFRRKALFAGVEKSLLQDCSGVLCDLWCRGINIILNHQCAFPHDAIVLE